MDMNHREKALNLLDRTDVSLAAAFEKTLPIADQQHAAVLTGILTTRAMVHATLARNDETAASAADLQDANTLLRRRHQAMRELVASYLVAAITSDRVERSRPAHLLVHDLHEADASVDDLLNEQLPVAEWASPASAGDFWRRKPDVTAGIPEPVRQVIAGLLAQMLLVPDNDGVVEWARRMAFALEAEGAELVEEIKTRIAFMTLGDAPDGIPF